MNHGAGLEGASPGGMTGKIVKLQEHLNKGVLFLSMLALLAACLILTGSVFLRYFLKVPTDWQDEASVFLLVGAVFMCGAYVQSQRGHIGIEVLKDHLSPAMNRIRLLICDVASFAFCAFFTWESWRMLHEAYVEGQTTSSSWAPPLWIPYGLMTSGMLLLTLQLLTQIMAGLTEARQ